MTNMLSTGVVVVAQAVQTVQAIQTASVSGISIWSRINPNLLISLLAICLTAFGTFVKIFGTNIKNNRPGNNSHCKEHLEKIKEVQKQITILEKEQNATQNKGDQIINNLKTEVATLKVKIDNSTKTIDELRTDTREVAQRLDELLRQLIDWVNQ